MPAADSMAAVFRYWPQTAQLSANASLSAVRPMWLVSQLTMHSLLEEVTTGLVGIASGTS